MELATGILSIIASIVSVICAVKAVSGMGKTANNAGLSFGSEAVYPVKEIRAKLNQPKAIV